VENWNHPPSFTAMHRPSIARVTGDRVILDGTTMGEVESYHLKTLKLVLEKTNEEADRLERTERARQEKRRDEAEAHRRSVEESAKRLRFD
jgi:sRNA-binding protein